MSDEGALSYPISREKLYEMAWSEPMTAIAKRFDVSSSYLARVFTQLNVPRPAPGYWAKVAVGKLVKKPALPAAQPAQESGWNRYNDFSFLPVRPPRPPYQETSWVHQWLIPETADLTKLGHKIAKELTGHAETVAAQAAEAHAEAERRRLRWEEERRQQAIEDDKKRWKEAGEISHTELLHVIEKWGEQKRIVAFFAEATLAVKQLPEVEQPQLLERIELARNLIGAADPLQEIQNWCDPTERYELLKKRYSYW